MAQTSYPFDAGAGAAVNEGQWQAMSRRFLATGVITGSLNQLAVTADGSAMSVTVASGDAFVEGFFYRNDAALALTIAAANATNPRIDTVVVRLDRAANTAALAVVTGTAATFPVPPALTQTDALYELPDADVRVPAAAGVIRAEDVTDRRAFVRNLTEAAANAVYLPKTGKAADSELLDGLDSTAFALLAGAAFTGDVTTAGFLASVNGPRFTLRAFAGTTDASGNVAVAHGEAEGHRRALVSRAWYRGPSLESLPMTTGAVDGGAAYFSGGPASTPYRACLIFMRDTAGW